MIAASLGRNSVQRVARRSGFYHRHPRASTSARVSPPSFSKRGRGSAREELRPRSRDTVGQSDEPSSFSPRLFLPPSLTGRRRRRRSGFLSLSLLPSPPTRFSVRLSSSYRDIPLGSAPSFNTSRGPFDVVSPSPPPPRSSPRMTPRGQRGEGVIHAS